MKKKYKVTLLVLITSLIISIGIGIISVFYYKSINQSTNTVNIEIQNEQKSNYHKNIDKYDLAMQITDYSDYVNYQKIMIHKDLLSTNLYNYLKNKLIEFINNEQYIKIINFVVYYQLDYNNSSLNIISKWDVSYTDLIGTDIVKKCYDQFYFSINKK